MQITINGKVVGIKFNNYAVEQFLKLKDLDKTSFGFVYGIVYGGYSGWKFIYENQIGFIDPEITFENIVDWVDSSVDNEAVAQQIKAIRDEYEHSQLYMKMVKDEQKKSQQVATQ